MKLFDRFPSYRYLFANGAMALRRFPLSLLSALVGVALAIVLADNDRPGEMLTLQKLLAAAALGLPLFLALGVFAEKRGWTQKQSWAFQASGAVFPVIYYFSLPPDLFSALMFFVRFLLLNIGLHFLVAFFPFSGRNQIGGFWQFNKSLFLRFLMAAMYSAVMFIGLAIALFAADQLFGIEIKQTRYLQLWILMAGLLNTWIFLAGIPEKLVEPDGPIEYPKALKVFTQYILLPLVILYFGILIAYEAKIIITWNWPKGWVSNLVLWYSVVGILSTLLLHPLRESSGNRWIGVFSRWFFRGLVPLVIMLFLAIMKRISDYGFTENRYFVLAMAVGLAIAVLYFIFSRGKDIRIIPAIVCLLAFASAYGPQSAFSVSEKYQKNRLNELLLKNEIISGDSLGTITTPLPFEDRKEMSAMVSYLVEWHGLAPFSEWIDREILAGLDTLPRYSRPEKISELIGFQYVSRWQTPESNRYFSFTASQNDFSTVTGYDYLIRIDQQDGEDYQQNIAIENDSCSIYLDRERFVLNVTFNKNPVALEFPLSPLVDSLDLDDTGDIPLKELTFEREDGNFRAIFVVDRITGTVEDNMVKKILSLDGYLLFRKLP